MNEIWISSVKGIPYSGTRYAMKGETDAMTADFRSLYGF